MNQVSQPDLHCERKFTGNGELVGFKPGSGGKGKLVSRGPVSFRRNSQKVTVHFIVVIDIMKNKNCIGAVGNVGKDHLGGAVTYGGRHTLKGPAFFKSLFTVEQTGPANPTVIFKIGDPGHYPVLGIGGMAQEEKEGDPKGLLHVHRSINVQDTDERRMKFLG
jgi:hypothetical protein